MQRAWGIGRDEEREEGGIKEGREVVGRVGGEGSEGAEVADEGQKEGGPLCITYLIMRQE